VKLHASSAGTLNIFTAYGDGYVAVNGERHENSVIVLPDQVLAWDAASFDALVAGNFDALAAMTLEVVLLGTGPRLRFPHPAMTRALTDARIGLEVMDLKAACRTYNVLVAEHRQVAAALLFT